MLADLIRLFLLETHDAWMLVVVVGVEYATQLRAERVRRLLGEAVPPWWKDRAYLREARALGVSRLWVVMALLATFAWTNVSGLEGITRLVTLAVGSAVVGKAWMNLRTDALARMLWRTLRPLTNLPGKNADPHAHEDAPRP